MNSPPLPSTNLVVRRPYHKILVLAAVLLFATPAGASVAGGGGKGQATPTGQQAPASTSPPSISGTAMSGQTLSSSTGTWSGVGLAYAYQWKRCDLSGNGCNGISGATGSTYSLGASDIGSTLRVDVTAFASKFRAQDIGKRWPIVLANPCR